MHPEQELFILSDAPHDATARAFDVVAGALSALLPSAEIEHVGSTAVPGCIGKGDIDVLVRVAEPDFAPAAATLDAVLARSSRNDATDTYVEYDWEQDGVSASVQLVVVGTLLDDRFRGFKSVLLGDPRAVERYNSFKASCAGMPMEQYRERKRKLIDELLAEGGTHVSDTPVADVREPRTAARERVWAIALAVAAGLLVCGCVSTVFLVLTGIIAEPVTVIEETLRLIRALAGG